MANQEYYMGATVTELPVEAFGEKTYPLFPAVGNFEEFGAPTSHYPEQALPDRRYANARGVGAVVLDQHPEAQEYRRTDLIPLPQVNGVSEFGWNLSPQNRESARVIPKRGSEERPVDVLAMFRAAIDQRADEILTDEMQQLTEDLRNGRLETLTPPVAHHDFKNAAVRTASKLEDYTRRAPLTAQPHEVGRDALNRFCLSPSPEAAHPNQADANALVPAAQEFFPTARAHNPAEEIVPERRGLLKGFFHKISMLSPKRRRAREKAGADAADAFIDALRNSGEPGATQPESIPPAQPEVPTLPAPVSAPAIVPTVAERVRAARAVDGVYALQTIASQQQNWARQTSPVTETRRPAPLLHA